MTQQIPQFALSIRQPWAALIIYDAKDVENRSRRTSFRGEVAIHASRTIEQNVVADLEAHLHPVTGDAVYFSDAYERRLHLQIGGIIGIAEIVDCVDTSDSPWFVGDFGYVIRNPRPIEFVPCPGMLGIFDWRKMLAKAA